MKVWRKPSVWEWGAALLLFLLLQEWLKPLQVLTDTGDLTSFYLLIALCLAADMLLPYRWLTFPAKLAGVLLLLHFTLMEGPFWDWEWLKALYGQLIRDLPFVSQQDWVAMHPLSRNLLFDLMLVLLVALIDYLVLEQRQVLWFVVMTEAYLAVLDTFLPYEADGGIIRTLVYGFLLLALTHMSKVSRIAALPEKRGWALANSLLAPLAIIAVSVGIAYWAPKQPPSWPDPIAYFTGSQEGKAPVKKVGYDNDDEQLGGPFQQDDTLVFTAVTNEQSYWRGDAKDVYTGKGWEKGESDYEVILNLRNHQWENELFHGQETEQVKAVLDFSGPYQYPTIFYPGQLKKVSEFYPENAAVVYDSTHQQLEVRERVPSRRQRNPGAGQAEGAHFPLLKMQRYTVEAEVPIVSEKAITQAGTDYPEEIRKKYLQLPDTLPERVRELAKEIAKNATTPYAKVRAVESYLRSSGKYRYETTDVPVPPEDQDFVDHFLFVSMRGYCDHFSSAMAVMLRTLDIPARWTKGFAPGEQVGTDEQGNAIIEVRNSDAHSWVEVYFPGIGWVPFEPTSSFSTPLRMKYDLQEETAQTSLPLPDAATPLPLDRGQDRLDEQEAAKGAAGGGFSLPWPVQLLLGAALLLGSFLAWRKRREAKVWWLRRKMDGMQSSPYQERYNLLIHMMESLYTRRKAGETLREYVNRLGISGEKRQDLRYLTEMYERTVYGLKGMEEKTRKFAEELIERLVRQMKP